MTDYNPGRFASTYETENGRELWDFLTQPDNIIRLETASDLGRPAVEGVGEQLLEKFGKEMLAGRVKQMIGHMVRQILEHRGWMVDQGNVKVHSVPFIKATRYRKPDRFTFHAFRNAGDRSDVVITDSREDDHLPDGVRWIYYVTFTTPLQAAVRFDIDDMKKLRKQVYDKGYHRIRVKRMLKSGSLQRLKGMLADAVDRPPASLEEMEAAIARGAAE